MLLCSSLARCLLFFKGVLLMHLVSLSRRAGKLNHHLEAAIHEAMSELDKMSGTVSFTHTNILSDSF